MQTEHSGPGVVSENSNENEGNFKGRSVSQTGLWACLYSIFFKVMINVGGTSGAIPGHQSKFYREAG